MNNMNASDSVAEWNTNLAIVLIPNSFILSLYIILGIAGNSLVILVYGFRIKKSEDRYFIPILAVSDLMASIVCASFGIALNMMQAEFTDWRLCKAWWFFAAFSTFMSIFLLLVIATHRYLKICRPLDKQMTLYHKRIAVGLSMTLAMIMAVPATILYGSVEFPNVDHTLVGMRCSKLKNVNKAGSLVYGLLVVTAVVGSMVVMIVFYSKIGLKIFNHFKHSTAVNYKIPPSNNSKSEMETSTTITVISSDDTTNTNDKRTDRVNKNDGNNEISVPSTEKEKTKARTSKERNKKTMHKFTNVFMVITIVFLICYIPKVILMVVEGLNPEFWENFSDSQRAGVLFIYRFYIVNNIVNPVVYAFMDTDFRQNTKAMVMCAKK